MLGMLPDAEFREASGNRSFRGSTSHYTDGNTDASEGGKLCLRIQDLDRFKAYWKSPW
jgi:hypothetical protein